MSESITSKLDKLLLDIELNECIDNCKYILLDISLYKQLTEELQSIQRQPEEGPAYRALIYKNIPVRISNVQGIYYLMDDGITVHIYSIEGYIEFN